MKTYLTEYVTYEPFHQVFAGSEILANSWQAAEDLLAGFKKAGLMHENAVILGELVCEAEAVERLQWVNSSS